VVLTFSLLYKNMATYAQAALYLKQLVWIVVVDQGCDSLEGAARCTSDKNAYFRAICCLPKKDLVFADT
jgi:hypothetical protein